MITDQKVQVIVKTVTNARLSYDLDPNASILDLKLRIKDDYLGNPAPDTQRIIIGGKVINNDVLLSDVFKQVCSLHFVFLFLYLFMTHLDASTT